MNIIAELDPLPLMRVDLNLIDFPKVEYFERPVDGEWQEIIRERHAEGGPDTRAPFISGLRFVGNVSYLTDSTLIEYDHDSAEREQLREFLAEWNADPKAAWVNYIQEIRGRINRVSEFADRADEWLTKHAE